MVKYNYPMLSELKSKLEFRKESYKSCILYSSTNKCLLYEQYVVPYSRVVSGIGHLLINDHWHFSYTD